MATDKTKIVNHVALNVGDTVTCFIDKTLKMSATLTGFSVDELLILQLAYILGAREHVQAGKTVVGQLHMGHSIIFFACTIEYILEKKRLAVCSYPNSFRVFEVRAQRRLPCTVPIVLSINDERVYGVAKNLNEQGTYIVVDPFFYKDLRTVQEGSLVFIEFFVDHPGAFHISGKIARANQRPASVELGVCFTDITAEHTQKLYRFLLNHR